MMREKDRDREGRRSRPRIVLVYGHHHRGVAEQNNVRMYCTVARSNSNAVADSTQLHCGLHCSLHCLLLVHLSDLRIILN